MAAMRSMPPEDCLSAKSWKGRTIFSTGCRRATPMELVIPALRKVICKAHILIGGHRESSSTEAIVEAAYFELASFVPAYHEHRAVGVPDHRFRNAAQQGSFQGAKTSATDHDRPCAQLLAQLHDLLVRISCPEVSLCYLPSR